MNEYRGLTMHIRSSIITNWRILLICELLTRSIKIRPSILRKAYHRAIESQKRLGEGLEEVIDEKIEREEREKAAK